MKFQSVRAHFANKQTKVKYSETFNFNNPLTSLEVENFIQKWWQKSPTLIKQKIEYFGWWPNFDAKEFLVKKFLKEIMNVN